MGNSLCKERIENAENSKNPIDRIIGRCAQICPANEVKSNYWQKHVLETGPPTSTQPKSTLEDGWRKTTLTVPNSKISEPEDIEKDDGPIAPPRRKRSSQTDRQPCGFKELFGNNVSRRSSCDSILNSLSPKERDMLQQRRKSKSMSNFNPKDIDAANANSVIVDTITVPVPVPVTVTALETVLVPKKSQNRPVLQRKISRVGNKKSDKFFGENLSDCLSDEPITPDPDPTIEESQFLKNTIDSYVQSQPNIALDNDVKGKMEVFIDTSISAPNIDEIIHDKVIERNPIKINDEINLVTVSKSATELAADKNVGDAEDGDRKSNLDKKAEFLMAMLDDDNLYKVSNEQQMVTPPRRSHLKKKSVETELMDVGVDTVDKATITLNNEFKQAQAEDADDEEYYKGMTPVEEPIIIPRRRHSKHICDDDTHLHKHIHSNPNQSPELSVGEAKTIVNISNAEIPSPEKPKRDFEIYEKTIIHQNANAVSNLTPVAANNDENEKPKVRHLSQGNLLSPKIIALSGEDIAAIQFNNQSNNDQRLTTMLKKCKSQQSFLTQELMTEIAERVYGFQDPFGLVDDSYDDGSSKCAPSSKLTNRKISVNRKESTVMPIQENAIENQSTTEKLDVTGNIKNTMNFIESLPFDANKIEIKSPPSVENKIKTIARPHSIATNKQHTDAFLKMERLNSRPNDQAFVPANCDTLTTSACHTKDMLHNTEPAAVATIEKLLEATDANDDQIIRHVLDDICTTNSSILNEFQKYLNDGISSEQQHQNEINDKLSDVTPTNSVDSINNSSEDDNTGSDVTVKEVFTAKQTQNAPNDVHNRLLEQVVENGERRDSIVEVDQWFLKHNDLLNLPRRGSESNTAYDTRKVFPFGKPEPGAGSQFFESKTLSKSADNVADDSVAENVRKIELKSKGTTEVHSGTDHSTLLKYFK